MATVVHFACWLYVWMLWIVEGALIWCVAVPLLALAILLNRVKPLFRILMAAHRLTMSAVHRVQKDRGAFDD